MSTRQVIRAAAAAVTSLALLLGSVSTSGATAPDVARATLPNGLRVVIVTDPLAPVVTTEVNYLVGADESPRNFPGMAHAQEHMLFRGSRGLTGPQLDTISAFIGGANNADTQHNVTQYFFVVPAQDLELALRIEALRMRDVTDSTQDWAQERGAIEQEVTQDLSSTIFRFFTKASQIVFAETPYVNTGLGTRESFERTTAAMLKKFYKTWYAPNNAILMIAGDVDPAKTLGLVRQLFGAIPSKRIPPRPAFRFQPLRSATITLESDLPVGLSIVTYRLPGSDSREYAAAQVLADVLGSKRGKIFGLVPEGKALDAGFDTDTNPKAALGFAYAALPPGSQLTDAAKMLKGVIAEYLGTGVPAELVEAAKRKEIAHAAFKLNSISGLAQEWSQAVAVEGRSSPDDDIGAIAKVTTADVNRIAKKYLVNSTALVAILTPKPAGKPSASAGFGGAESFAPKAAKNVTLPEWAKTALTNVAAPRSNVSPAAMALPNGLRLIVQTEKISPTATVIGEVKHDADLETANGREGVDEVLDGLFSYGTTTLDRLAFQKALDDIAADESAGPHFGLSVLASNFDRGVELLADNVLHPALPAPAFSVVQKQTAGEIEGRRQSPDYLVERSLAQALYPKGDPSQREATPQTVRALTLDDVNAYYNTVFRPDLTTIIVIGDVSPEQAKASVEKWFGGWKATGTPPPTDLPPAAPNKPAAANVPATGRIQDNATLVETVGITRFDPDYYALRLGNDILSSGFDTRLYQDLRVTSGLVYSVDASLDAGKTRTTFAVHYGCDPDKVSRARALIARDLRAMQTTPASADELERAKAKRVRRIPLSESSEAAIATGLLSRALIGLPLDEPVRAVQQYLAMTADQIRAAFAKWVRPDDFVQVVEGPTPK